MKKGTFLKRASVIALSAVMTAGISLAAAGCGGGSVYIEGLIGGGIKDLSDTPIVKDRYIGETPGDEDSVKSDTLTVWIFCNEADADTNDEICQNWVKKYNEVNHTNYKVKFKNESDKDEYFKALSDRWTAHSMPDIIYLSPRYVRSYAEAGRVLNLSDYLDKVSADPAVTGEAAREKNVAALGDVWSNALSYYGYRRGSKTDYTMGQGIHYAESGEIGAGFYTDAYRNGVGLYGLPKDYSNFSTGYNKFFFTDAIKKDVTTYTANQKRNVQAPDGDGDNDFTHSLKYTAATGKAPGYDNVITYAVDVEDYDNPYTEEVEHINAKAGDPAPIINIGIPTRYKPFNFFRYQTFKAAYEGGDPVATLVQEYSNDVNNDGKGDGYVVTLPGFPDETFDVPEEKAPEATEGTEEEEFQPLYHDENAPYDTSMGHIVYTHAEYSALLWAMSFYLNTFPWDNGQTFDDTKTTYGGHFRTLADGKQKYEVVYAGEQYDGTLGTPLYLLPWLYSNDADIIDATSTFNADPDLNNSPDVTDPTKWTDYVSKQSNVVVKKNLNGTNRAADVQFGYNTERFIETYAAFAALGSDWNGNTSGDTAEEHSTNGWTYFRQGKCIFYGAGSWDSATRNESAHAEFQFGQIPTSVAENFALYSEVKDANYVMKTYSNGATQKGTGEDAGVNDAKQRENLSDGLKVYSKDEIIQNQLLRQDKWAARMDSVGYAVNGQVSNYTGAHAWKIEAAVSLVMALTIEEEAQKILTYSGAQLPNFISQTKEFLDYNVGDNVTNGAFKDMLTPEGFADTAPENADEVWNWYYDLAEAMAAASKSNSEKNKTVKQYLDQYWDSHPHPTGETKIRYDEAYADDALSTFVGAMQTNVAPAMKVLRMFPFNRSDRDLNIRMQYGLNAVRDSSMYTYSTGWMNALDARGDERMLGYHIVSPLNKNNQQTNFKKGVGTNPNGGATAYITPFVWCLSRTETARDDLVTAVNSEKSALGMMS